VLYTTSASAGGVRAGISGSATATSFIVESHTFTGNSIAFRARADEFPSVSPLCNTTGVNAALIRMEGMIVVANAGTFTVQFAQSVSNGTASSVLVNSHMRLYAHT
jgi:hypothetical protein